MLEIAAGEHQRDGLHQVGADQPQGREAGVEHDQRDHDHRAGPDAGDADEQAAERADGDGDERPDRRVGVGVAGRRARDPAQVDYSRRAYVAAANSRAKPMHFFSRVSRSSADRRPTWWTSQGPSRANGTEPRISHWRAPSWACPPGRG